MSKQSYKKIPSSKQNGSGNVKYANTNQIERKFVSTGFSDAIGTSTSVYDLTAIAQGLDDANRIGRIIEIDSVCFNGYFEKDGNASSSVSDDIHFVLVYARDNTTPVWDDLFVSNPVRSIPRPQVSHKGHYFRDAKYTILWDFYTSLDKGSHYTVPFRGDVKVGRPAMYNGTTTADITSGRLMLIGKSSNNSAYQPDFTAVFCLYFTDI